VEGQSRDHIEEVDNNQGIAVDWGGQEEEMETRRGAEMDLEEGQVLKSSIA
jgi:hypothetical protein